MSKARHKKSPPRKKIKPIPPSRFQQWLVLFGISRADYIKSLLLNSIYTVVTFTCFLLVPENECMLILTVIMLINLPFVPFVDYKLDRDIEKKLEHRKYLARVYYFEGNSWLSLYLQFVSVWLFFRYLSRSEK